MEGAKKISGDENIYMDMMEIHGSGDHGDTEQNAEYIELVDLNSRKSCITVIDTSSTTTRDGRDFDDKREYSHRQAETENGNEVMSPYRCNQLISILWKVALIVVGIGSVVSIIFISFLDRKVPVQSKAVSRTTKSRVTKFIIANWAANPNPSPAVEDSIDYITMSRKIFNISESTITHREDASQFFSSGGYIWETSLKSNLVIVYKHQHGKDRVFAFQPQHEKQEHFVLVNEININSAATVITSLIFKDGRYLIVSFKERGLYLVDLKGNIMQVVTSERICSIASEIIGHERLFAMKYNSNILYSLKLVNGCWKFQKSIKLHNFTPNPQINNRIIMYKGIIHIYNAVRNQIIRYNSQHGHISIKRIKLNMANCKESTVNQSILIDVDKFGASIILNNRCFQLHIMTREGKEGFIHIPKKNKGDKILSVAALPQASVVLALGQKVDYEVWIWVLVNDGERVKSYFINEDTFIGGIMNSLSQFLGR